MRKGIKKKKAKAPKKRNPPARITPNGRKIWDMMQHHKIKGNHKDYVIFIGDVLLDTYGDYTIKRDSGEASEMIMLVRKSDLTRIIGSKEAEKFWCSKIGKRTNRGIHLYFNHRRPNVQDGA